MSDIEGALLELAHDLGREERRLAILGEGNVSAKLPNGEFLVKASGTSLGTLRADQLTRCSLAAANAMFGMNEPTDSEIEAALMNCRLDAGGKKPSVEALFHAWLLSLEGVNFVGHCHPVSANQVLCSPRAREFAKKRIFPDEVVCCGAASVFVPYVDPGLPLAREIREQTWAFVQERGELPRLILLQNHGIIAIGATCAAVLTCSLMAAKAAEIFAGAAVLGGPVFMSEEAIARIATRPDEAYRQRELKI